MPGPDDCRPDIVTAWLQIACSDRRPDNTLHALLYVAWARSEELPMSGPLSPGRRTSWRAICMALAALAAVAGCAPLISTDSGNQRERRVVEWPVPSLVTPN